MIRKLITGLTLTLCMAGAMASQIVLPTTGLTETQVAELKLHAAKMAVDSSKSAESPLESATPATVVTLAATWGQQAATAAEGFARAINIAAKELGVTVNDFLHTDAGRIAAILIIWKVAGAAIAKIFAGILFITFGLVFTRIMYMRLFTSGYAQVEYSRFFGMFKGTKMVRIPKTIGQLESDGEWLAFWVMMGMAALAMFGGVWFF